MHHKSKKMLTLLKIGFTLLICLQGILADGCAQKQYGNRNIVCVCNSSYCDTINYDEVADLSTGVVIKFTSSEKGLRFNKTYEKFKMESSTPDLIPPVRFFVNLSQQHQVMLGFGAALTDSAGFNIATLSKETQNNLLRSYFSKEGIQYTQIKVAMGGTDFSNRSYTYDDIPNDRNLSHFKLTQEDHLYKIPYLKQIFNMSARQINLQMSVWTAPFWMKNTGFFFKEHSSLKREYYQLWAQYFVRFLQEYEREGIKFWAISPQNQPTLGTGWSLFPVPSMGWSPASLKYWIRDYLVPTLGKNSYGYLKILILDDDFSNLPHWLQQLFSDDEVQSYISGIAVHWHGDSGKDFPDVLRKTHMLFPEKFIVCNGPSSDHKLLSSAELGSWATGEYYAAHIFKGLNNWSAGWIDWNMVLDTNGGPSYLHNHSDAPIIVNSTGNEFYKQPSFYIIGHFSKFIPPNSIRIGLDTQNAKQMEGVAFLTPDSSIIIVLNNKGFLDVEVEIIDPAYGIIQFIVPAKSINTLIYRTEQAFLTAATPEAINIIIPSATTINQTTETVTETKDTEKDVTIVTTPWNSKSQSSISSEAVEYAAYGVRITPGPLHYMQPLRNQTSSSSISCQSLAGTILFIIVSVYVM